MELSSPDSSLFWWLEDCCCFLLLFLLSMLLCSSLDSIRSILSFMFSFLPNRDCCWTGSGCYRGDCFRLLRWNRCLASYSWERIAFAMSRLIWKTFKISRRRIRTSSRTTAPTAIPYIRISCLNWAFSWLISDSWSDFDMKSSGSVALVLIYPLLFYSG